MRVALFRPIEDAQRSAAVLRARGFEPAIAPAMELRATGACAPPGAFDALLATSANAFAFLSIDARERLRGLKLYAVGERTAEAAAALGFDRLEEVAPDAETLARLLISRLQPASRLLYLAARDRKGELETALGAAGRELVAMEVYLADARQSWRAEELASVSICAAAMHYSRRSAEAATDLAQRQGLARFWFTTLHVCISEDAAEPLRSFGAKRMVISAAAREIAMIDALGKAANRLAADRFRSPP